MLLSFLLAVQVGSMKDLWSIICKKAFLSVCYAHISEDKSELFYLKITQ